MRETNVNEVRRLFHGPEMDLLLGAAQAGNAAVCCWIAADGASALLWDQCNNVLYAGGSPSSAALAALIEGVVHPAGLAAGRPYLSGRGMDGGATTALEQAVQRHSPGRGKVRCYAYLDAAAPEPGRFPLPPGVEVVPITRDLLEAVHPAGVDEVLDEISQMWPSTEAFLQRGFGTAAIAAGAVACWCTTEYMSGDRCGIGIATAEAWRRMGVGAATAAACVREARRRSLRLHWECAVRNTASARLAEKLGFRLLEENEIVHWRITPEEPG